MLMKMRFLNTFYGFRPKHDEGFARNFKKFRPKHGEGLALCIKRVSPLGKREVRTISSKGSNDSVKRFEPRQKHTH